MKRLASFFSLLFLVFLVQACMPVEGDPNLSGQWTCTETSEIFMKSFTGTSVYTVKLNRDAANLDKYYIDNFYKLGSGVTVAVLVYGYTAQIPKQSVNGFVFEGTGVVEADYNLIELTYTADDGGGEVDNVTATYNR